MNRSKWCRTVSANRMLQEKNV